MSPFHNYQDVHNQAGVQTNNGPIHHGPSYFGNVYMANVPCPPAITLAQAESLAELDKDILESLSFPEMFDRRNQIEHAHPGTCEWITHIDDFQSWHHQPRGLLWIRGKPGAGKSTLMSFLYHRIQDLETNDDEKVVLDFFFDSNGTELQKTPVGMFRSLLNQLFSHLESARPRMRRIFEQRNVAFGSAKQTWNWHQRELETHFRHALMEAAKFHRITVLVDALDEVGESNAAEIANYLQKLDSQIRLSGQRNVHFIVSGRHYPVVAQATGTEIVVELHNTVDIFTYVEDRLLPTIESACVSESRSSRSVWGELITSMSQRSAGIFQWVRHILPMVERAIAEGEGLETIFDRLHDIPTALHQLYEHILLHGIRPENRAESCVMFQWVCLTERLFSLNELRRALSFENEVLPLSQRRNVAVPAFNENNRLMKLRMNVLSGGLIEAVFDRERKEELARIIHQSAHRYLTSHGLSKLMTLPEVLNSAATNNKRLDSGKVVAYCHRNLFSACIRYLANKDLAMSLPETINITARDRYLRDKSGKPWLDYAVLYMLVHAEKAGEWLDDTCTELISLLQRVYIGWLRLCRFLDPESVQWLYVKSSLLHVAAAKNLVAILRMLARNSGYSLNAIDEDLNTPLHLAARFGHDECIKFLVEAGANLLIKNKTNHTAIEVAARHGHLAMMRAALSHKGSKILRAIYSPALKYPTFVTADMTSSLSTRSDNAPRLSGPPGSILEGFRVESSAYVPNKLSSGPENLNLAPISSARSFLYSALPLTSESVHASRQTTDEWTGEEDLYGKPLVGTHGNSVPLFPRFPVLRNNSWNLYNALDSYSESDRWSPLYIAASQNNIDMAREMLDMLKYLPRHDERESRLAFALQIASFEGHIDMVRFLLAQDVDVNAPGGRLGTAINAATSMDNQEVVTLLLIASAQQKAKKVKDIAKSMETERLSQQMSERM